MSEEHPSDPAGSWPRCFILQILSCVGQLPESSAEACHVIAAITAFNMSPEGSLSCVVQLGREGTEEGEAPMETA